MDKQLQIKVEITGDLLDYLELFSNDIPIPSVRTEEDDRIPSAIAEKIRESLRYGQPMSTDLRDVINAKADDLLKDVMKEDRLFWDRRPLPRLIGLLGRKRAGKSTFAGNLADLIKARGLGAVRLSIANEIRDEMSEVYCPHIPAEVFRLDDKDTVIARPMGVHLFDPINGPEHALYGSIPWPSEPVGPIVAELAYFHPMITLRKLMQWYGTDYRRKQNPAYWTAKFAERLAKTIGGESLNFDPRTIVVDDLRGEDECHLIRAFGGYVLKIEQCPEVRVQDDHPNEAGVDAVRQYLIDGTVFPEMGKLDVAAKEFFQRFKA